jgi:hypothetical protein
MLYQRIKEQKRFILLIISAKNIRFNIEPLSSNILGPMEW